MNKKTLDDLVDKKLALVKLDSVSQLPRQFEAYTVDTKMDYIVKHYSEKHGKEPKLFFHLKCGITNMIVVEVV